MIHATFCYDSDPKDRWFEEKVEIREELMKEFEKYLSPELLLFYEQMSWKVFNHFGGYEVTLGGPLNNPVTAVLNAKGVWKPTSVLAVEDHLTIYLNGAVVYNN